MEKDSTKALGIPGATSGLPPNPGGAGTTQLALQTKQAVQFSTKPRENLHIGRLFSLDLLTVVHMKYDIDSYGIARG